MRTRCGQLSLSLPSPHPSSRSGGDNIEIIGPEESPPVLEAMGVDKGKERVMSTPTSSPLERRIEN